MNSRHNCRTAKMCVAVAMLAMLLGFGCQIALAQAPANQGATTAFAASEGATDATSANAEILKELEAMRVRIQELEARLKAQSGAPTTPLATVASDARTPESQRAADPSSLAQTPAQPVPNTSVLNTEDRKVLDFLEGTTINLGLDGYYEYNFNRPVGRVNLLRAYDVSSNSFSLNQASLILERAPNLAAGRRFGARLDLQFGQATETLQGNAANEPRPQVYRPVFQAYGTYIAPLGSGLTVDFGKWASAMGYENNYTKDQFNYSRSYFFDFLPFYHMGFRTSYNVNDRLTLSYWLVNGVQQTEDFNGFKSQVVQVVVKPAKTLQWNFIYHTGKEQHDVNGSTPDGRLHILDTYVSWNATPRLTLVGETDYVINRVLDHSAPAHVTGGASYAHYQFTPKVGVTVRGEYLSDRGGLFSGVTQALKETTLTYDYKVADGFLLRSEWRRDFSNQPFFLTELPRVLKKEQNTATLGLVWWWGRKEGAW